MLHRVSEGGHMVGRDIDAKRKKERVRELHVRESWQQKESGGLYRE